MAQPGHPQQSLSLFPPPPAQYKLYAKGAEQAPPEPPAPVKGKLQIFGYEWDPEEPVVAPLQVPVLFERKEDGSVDVRGELQRLNAQLLFLFVELLAVLADNPDDYARLVTALSQTLHNMHHLVNLRRPHQARATLEFLLEREVAAKRNALSELRSQVAAVEQLLCSSAAALRAVDSNTAQSGGLAVVASHTTPSELADGDLVPASTSAHAVGVHEPAWPG